jgi:hypothetical protein
MKGLLVAFFLLSSFPLYAKSYKIEINNQSYEKVAFGIYKGIPVPSLCEDGFCWEEVNVKFRPVQDANNVQGTKTIYLETENFEQTQYFLMIGEFQVELAACELLDEDRQYFYPPMGPQLTVDITGRNSYCIDQETTTINVE